MKQIIYFFKNRLLYYGLAALIAVLSVYMHAAIFLLFFCFYLLWLKKLRGLPLQSLFAIILLFSIFFLRAELEKRDSKTNISPSRNSFGIVLIDSPVINGDRWSVVGEEITIKEKVMLTYKLKTEAEKTYYEEQKMVGETCNFTGILEKPAVATNESGFDYQKYLWNKSIYWQLEIDQLSTKSCSKQPNDLFTKLKTVRLTGSKWIEKHFSHETKAIAIALIFGDRQWIDTEIQSAYQKLGIIHLLAISGSHIVVLVGLFYFILIRFGLTKENAITLLLFILPFYAILTGLSPSVNRAVCMSMLLLFKRKSNVFASFSSIDMLCIAFLLYLFYEPKVMFDIGFILSFTVCIFLLLSSYLLLQASSHPMKQLLFTTFISEFSVLPIILYYFYELPTLSLPANIIFIPLYSIILLPYFLAVFVVSFFIPDLATFLLGPIDLLMNASEKAVMIVSSLPFSTIIFGKPSLMTLLSFIIALPVFFFLYEKKPKNQKKCLYVIPMIILLIQYFFNLYSPYGEVTFIDVGQGDSIFIKEPFQKGIYLIDTGGTVEWGKEAWQIKNDPYEVGKDVVVPFLKSKGVGFLDKLILTHGDLDHIGGSMAVLKSIKVKELVLPLSSIERSKEEKEIIAYAKNRGIPIAYVEFEQMWQAGNDPFYILFPIDPNAENKNNQSIVIKGRIGGLDWLFTGDLEEEGEKKLLEKYPMLTTDILKVGHHGSKTSTSSLFLNSLHPKAAIISAGKNNRYGHPHKDVVERLQKKNIRIWRTDKNGAITYKYYKKTGTFYSQLP
ncbi:DNA internalization-related competence protein ComEC/Rec2 [Niallia sp. 03133]|uniref:DNA internalization-related competence protein ComEC/Rec2 n=1 Tax=Niallia sp. 03133 TaxID=3458060 RepID=UPI004043EB13